MEGPLLTKSEDNTIDGDSSSNDEHNIGITINDDSSSHEAVNVEWCNPFTEERAWCLIDYLLHLVQIIAAILVVTQAKDEHPQAALLVWIISYTCGCVTTLLIPFINCIFPSYYNHLTELLKRMLEYLFMGWAVLLTWIYQTSSSSLYDNTLHFWLCIVFLAFICIRYGPVNIKWSAICLVVGVICPAVLGSMTFSISNTVLNITLLFVLFDLLMLLKWFLGFIGDV